MTTLAVPYFDETAVRSGLDAAGATAAIVAALRAGLDPSADAPRSVVPIEHGQFLLMPSQTANSAGVKVCTVAPDNPQHGLPRIQALYLHFDAATLTLQALLDGSALTSLRTPAVSSAVLDAVRSRFTEPLDIVVFGAGPQATNHVESVAALEGVTIRSVRFVVRRPDTVSLPAIGASDDVAVLASSDPGVVSALQVAHLVICATSASEPVFDSRHLSDTCVVVAVGSHEPDARELDAALMGRATVVVEDFATALREGGDVIMAITEGTLCADDLVTMSQVVRGEVTAAADRPLVFKTSGMAWEDIVVAEAVIAAVTSRRVV